MDKLLFIVPPNINYEDFTDPPNNVKSVIKNSKKFGVVITDIPLGIIALSAYIKKLNRVESILLDFNVLLNKLENFEFKSFQDFFQTILSSKKYKEYNPNIICISCLFTSSFKSMLDIGKCCRQIFPDSIILAGGGVPTNMYKEIYKESDCFNALCYGEGKKPLINLIRSEDKISYLKKDLSWITKEKIKEKIIFKQDFIEDLDEIPRDDYDILDLEGYGINPTISAYTSINEKRKSMPIMTSRGCPHRCCFCSSYTVHGRKMRYHSINRVIEDLTYLKNKFDIKTIIFQDDNFTADKSRAKKIIESMYELQLTAFFPNSLALYTLDKEMLEALKKIGVNQLVLSVESGSDRVLREIMHKPLNLNIVNRVVKDCRELGIYSDVNILIGLPGETKKDIEDARIFLRTVNANWFRINVATPLVGSEMFEICNKKGYIKGNYLECNYKKAIVETEDFTIEYIQEIAYLLNLELNFVENSDFRLGNYKIALNGFENAIKAKSDHVLAYYYASKCYEKIGEKEKAGEYLEKAKLILKESQFWQKYVKIFNINF
jgi:anaerobic magnesium-protoporphyrin IX monomethyl ester cyclase